MFFLSAELPAITSASTDVFAAEQHTHCEYLHKCSTAYTPNSASSLLYQRDLKPPKWHIFTLRNRLNSFIPHPPNYSSIQIWILPPVYLLTFTTIFLRKTFLSFTHAVSVILRVTGLQLKGYILMEPHCTETWGFGLAPWICPSASSKAHFSLWWQRCLMHQATLVMQGTHLKINTPHQKSS